VGEVAEGVIAGDPGVTIGEVPEEVWGGGVTLAWPGDAIPLTLGLVVGVEGATAGPGRALVMVADGLSVLIATLCLGLAES